MLGLVLVAQALRWWCIVTLGPRWNTRVVQPDALEEVERLKRESSDDLLCYGGSQFVSALQQRGLVDEYALSMVEGWAG